MKSGTKYDKDARTEGVLPISFRRNEAGSAPNISDLAAHRVIMPPACISGGRNQTNDRRAGLGGFESLLHPVMKDFPVRRIHPANARPLYGKRVVGLGEIVRVFGVPIGRADIHGKTEFFIQLGVEIGGRRPIGTARMPASFVSYTGKGGCRGHQTSARGQLAGLEPAPKTE